MALYRYKENISPYERYGQITILLDSGQSLVMHQGGTYDLTNSERLRASKRIVLVPSSDPVAQEQPLQTLPVVGSLSDGDVPVWDEALGAFVPGTGGGGGGGSGLTYTWNATTSAYELNSGVKTYYGPVPPDSVGETMSLGDSWIPTEEPA